MDIPKLQDADINGKRVIVRLDLDVNPENQSQRLESSLDTMRFLYENASEVLVIGHRGRPEGQDESLSLKPVVNKLTEKLGREINFEENLRFDAREKDNDESFARELASKADFFVNESFADSHREHASIVGLPRLLPHAAGFRFLQEIENLSKVFSSSQRPVVAILSGAKEDKLNYLDSFKNKADRVLIGGRLPVFMDENYQNDKVVVGKLLPDKEDITMKTIEIFESELNNAKTILVSGPLGRFEEEGHRLGTERVFKKIVELDAFKVAGGGDTAHALFLLDLSKGFNWISTGGGAMLEFLSKGTLPGIEALLN